METTRLNEKADKEGFIAIYPDGTGKKLFRRKGFFTWNAGDCCGEAYKENIGDVEFIRALLDSLQTTLPVDPKRIYVTGLSNGGSMTYRLGCELSERIAAIAVVSADFNYADCRPTNPVSVIIFHGTADDHVPYEGGIGERAVIQNSKKPVSFAVSFWIKHNGTATVSQKEEHGSIIKETYGKGRDDSEVILYTIKGGGHAWPGGVKGKRKGAAEPTREISATDLMWDFFERHPKK
jgi:polyhydroxybutyrate depolymerase